jgi:hypothetical protein
MDAYLQNLRRRARTGDIEAARALVRATYRLWNQNYPTINWDDVSQEYEDLVELAGSNQALNELREALFILGNITAPVFLERWNEALENSGIPINPMGFAKQMELDLADGPPKYWALFKETYSLEPEINMHGEPVCDPEERGGVPGFQRHYGIQAYYYLYPDESVVLEINDLFRGQKLDDWVGRGDAQRSYELSLIHGHYGGAATPETWVDDDEYLRRKILLREILTETASIADPNLDFTYRYC